MVSPPRQYHSCRSLKTTRKNMYASGRDSPAAHPEGAGTVALRAIDISPCRTRRPHHPAHREIVDLTCDPMIAANYLPHYPGWCWTTTNHASVDAYPFSRPAAVAPAAESAHELALCPSPSAVAGWVEWLEEWLEAPQHRPSMSGCSGRGASWCVC